MVFFSSLLIFLSFLSVVLVDPLYPSSLHVSILFSLFNSLLTQAFKKGNMQRVVWMTVLQERGLQLDMHLYPFLNEVGCVWMLDALILVILLVILWPILSCFSFGINQFTSIFLTRFYTNEKSSKSHFKREGLLCFEC